MTEVGVLHQADLLEEGQGPVDRGEVGIRPDLGVNLLRGGVPQRPDRFQDPTALGGDAVAAVPQALGRSLTAQRPAHGPEATRPLGTANPWALPSPTEMGRLD